VIKVRGSDHSKEVREYVINSNGQIVVGKVLNGYEGLLTGAPSSVEDPNAVEGLLPRDR
jgi:hypothetical protein